MGTSASVLQSVTVTSYGPSGGVSQFIALFGSSVVFNDQSSASVLLLSPSGARTTLASGISNLLGIAVDPTTGNVIVADGGRQCIVSITAAGAVAIVAGSASGVIGSSDGAGTTARFSYLAGVAVSSFGLIAVADSGNSLIRVISGGVTTTLAGGGGGTSSGCQDGTGTSVYFSYPSAVAFDGQNNVIVADTLCGRIRKVSPQGVTITLAGWNIGFADGFGTSASFWSPQGVAIDLQGNMIVTDTDNQRIRKVTPVGLVTTLAGTGAYASGSPVDGAASSATFANPQGVAVDPKGRIFVVESLTNRIRLITFSLPTFSNICDSTWHHLALTSNTSSNTLSAYIDGALSLQIQQPLALPPPGASTLSIGWSGNLSDGAAGSHYTGALSDLRIYNRSLAAAEVLSLTQAAPSPVPTASSSPTPSGSGTGSESSVSVGVSGEQTCTVKSQAIPARFEYSV